MIKISTIFYELESCKGKRKIIDWLQRNVEITIMLLILKLNYKKYTQIHSLKTHQITKSTTQTQLILASVGFLRLINWGHEIMILTIYYAFC